MRRRAGELRSPGGSVVLAIAAALTLAACGSVEDDEPGETVASTATTSTVATPSSGATGPDGPEPERGGRRNADDERSGPSFRSAALEVCERVTEDLRKSGAGSTRAIVDKLGEFSSRLRALGPPASFEPTLESIDSLVADARRDPRGTIGADANLASLTVRLTAISTGFERAGLADCGA